MKDAYRVLPHRDIRAVNGTYEHKPCGMDLTEADVIEANWCGHCAAIINNAARKRAQQHIQMIGIEFSDPSGD